MTSVLQTPSSPSKKTPESNDSGMVIEDDSTGERSKTARSSVQAPSSAHDINTTMKTNIDHILMASGQDKTRLENVGRNPDAICVKALVRGFVDGNGQIVATRPKGNLKMFKVSLFIIALENPRDVPGMIKVNRDSDLRPVSCEIKCSMGGSDDAAEVDARLGTKIPKDRWILIEPGQQIKVSCWNLDQARRIRAEQAVIVQSMTGKQWRYVPTDKNNKVLTDKNPETGEEFTVVRETTLFTAASFKTCKTDLHAADILLKSIPLYSRLDISKTPYTIHIMLEDAVFQQEAHDYRVFCLPHTTADDFIYRKKENPDAVPDPEQEKARAEELDGESDPETNQKRFVLRQSVMKKPVHMTWEEALRSGQYYPVGIHCSTWDSDCSRLFGITRPEVWGPIIQTHCCNLTGAKALAKLDVKRTCRNEFNLSNKSEISRDGANLFFKTSAMFMDLVDFLRNNGFLADSKWVSEHFSEYMVKGILLNLKTNCRVRDNPLHTSISKKKIVINMSCFDGEATDYLNDELYEFRVLAGRSHTETPMTTREGWDEQKQALRSISTLPLEVSLNCLRGVEGSPYPIGNEPCLVVYAILREKFRGAEKRGR